MIDEEHAGRELHRVTYTESVSRKFVFLYCVGGSIVNVETALRRRTGNRNLRVLDYRVISEDVVLHV